ncbi:hypothetical protein J6590_003845 [Homalodisca vitripennis]|nr:hypothetical protein J6590_003845 [Homalodisca vitripennis]
MKVVHSTLESSFHNAFRYVSYGGIHPRVVERMPPLIIVASPAVKGHLVLCKLCPRVTPNEYKGQTQPVLTNLDELIKQFEHVENWIAGDGERGDGEMPVTKHGVVKK